MQDINIRNEPAYNRGYMDAVMTAKRADGRDWVRARMALDEAYKKTRILIAKKDAEISVLRQEIADRDSQIIDLQSRLEALFVAWKHRGETE